MPTATARKSTPATPRKRRTRKATAKKVTPTPLNTTVETKLNGDPIVTETVKEEVKVDLISREQYIADAKARWSIHQYEIQELWKDLQVVGTWIVTHSKTAYEYSKKSYDRAFNQTT